MQEIIISVDKLDIELFTELCKICNCFIEKEIEVKNNNLLVTVSSYDVSSLYKLGFEFGAYAPTFTPS